MKHLAWAGPFGPEAHHFQKAEKGAWVGVTKSFLSQRCQLIQWLIYSGAFSKYAFKTQVSRSQICIFLKPSVPG